MKICLNCKLLLRKNKMDISIVFGFVFENCSKLSFTDIAGLCISVIALVVSIRTARHQKKVDLFDKRFKIYSYLNTCYEACKNVVNNYNLDGFMLISVLDSFYFSLSRTYSNIYSDMFHKNIEVGLSANLTQLEIDKKSTDVKQLENRLRYEKESINVDYISILEMSDFCFSEKICSDIHFVIDTLFRISKKQNDTEKDLEKIKSIIEKIESNETLAKMKQELKLL